ncbi:Mbeg1-like protein [Streptococcus macacae]|uniref:Triacylglycerol lipase n=1 Tax=Streptococcus macacae NCTC 11558 TaxID=764298 RepID=G5JV92_9STRE|nr:Mbeg1-like protein [Streptococcus macacae]EHJ52357.1 hypothetical protein STRMA_1804 [Streptococcus macacae NCTC 11558]SUN77718.1 Protein of uncharacterised function (DUF2974) [Streptococcus macacae NCTC 11558]
MSSDIYSEHERQKIAQAEYKNLKRKQKLRITNDKGKKETIGTVREVVTNKTGLKAYVVESPDKKEVSVLYQGSVSPPGKGSKADWLDNDIPMAKNIIMKKKEATPQLKSAAAALNHVLATYPKAKVTVYGHSLGSMNAQYALANVSDVKRISGAYVYEGPNVYPVLTGKQKAKVAALKYRTHNYIDPKDSVPLGYVKDTLNYKVDLNSENAVGIVYHVDSKTVFNPIEQHMWGGYQWRSDGSLKIEKDSSARESKYRSALDSVALGMYHFPKLKAQREKGGLSGKEEFFLDSTQAAVVASGLVKAAARVEKEVASAKKSAVEAAEILFNTTKTAPFMVTELSPEEIQEAYAEAGVTYDSIVGKTERHFSKKVKQAEKIAQAYTDLQGKIQSGVEEAFAEDAKLAGEFKQWSEK